MRRSLALPGLGGRVRGQALIGRALSQAIVLGIVASASAQPVVTPLAAVTVTGDISHDVIRKILPLQVRIPARPGSTLWLGDLYYCGSASASRNARVLGVLYPGPMPAQAAVPVLISADCNDMSLSGLAARTQGGAAAIGAI